MSDFVLTPAAVYTPPTNSGVNLWSVNSPLLGSPASFVASCCQCTRKYPGTSKNTIDDFKLTD
eukprot:3401735-Rhodomonas_salina.2